MTNELTNDTATGKAAMAKPVPDDALADPVAVVLMLLQEAGNRQPQDSNISTSLEKAEVKERVLRRMLEASLDRPTPAKRPSLKIVK